MRGGGAATLGRRRCRGEQPLAWRRGQKIVGVPASASLRGLRSTRRQRRVSGSLILRQARRRDGRRVTEGGQVLPGSCSLLPGEARFARKIFTRQEPNRPYRVPGPRNRRIERRLWAGRPKGPSPVVSAGRPPAFPSRRGHDRSHGQPGAPGVSARSGPGVRGPEVLLQGVAPLSLGCSGGAFGSSFRASVAPFSGFARWPLCPADSREAPVGVGRGGLGWARPASGTREPAEKARNRRAHRAGWLRYRRTAGSVAPSEPRESSRLFGLGCSCAGARGGGGFWAGPRRPASFSLTGEEKKRSLSALRKQLPGSTEIPVLRERSRLGAAEPLGWGRWIGAPGGAFSQPAAGRGEEAPADQERCPRQLQEVGSPEDP